MALLSRAELLGETLLWLFELQVGDEVLRFAQSKVDALGETYLPGFSFSGEVPDSVDPFSESPSGRSVDVTLWLRPLSAPQLMEEGFDLAAARGRLYLYSPTSSRRVLQIDGLVRGVEYAEEDEPLTFSVVEIEEDDSALFPPRDARVTKTTWPDAAESALGEWYPFVIGAPGSAGVYPAPALMVVSVVREKLLIAGHLSGATAVDVINDDNGVTALGLATETTLDGLGRPCTLVDIHGTGVMISATDKYFVRWGGAGGGLLLQDGGLLAGAGDVFRWMLQHSRLRIDHGRLAAAVQLLNGYRLDTVIMAAPDSRFSPWSWIVDHLLPILPVTIRSSADGFYPVVWRLGATADLASAHLDIDAHQGVLEGAVSFSRRDDVANDLVLLYANDPRLGSYRGRLALTGDPVIADEDPDASLSLYCIASRSRYRDPGGLPETRTMEEVSEVVQADGTAAAVLSWLAQRYALQSRLASFSFDLDLVGFLEPGDVVTVTYAGLSWVRKVCLLEEIVRTSDRLVSVSLRVINDLAQIRKPSR